MRRHAIVLLIFCSLVMIACGDEKVYQEYTDFDDRYWLASDTVKFYFTIDDTVSRYNLYCNIRNSTHYPFSRIFVNFALADSSGGAHHKALLNDFLFDPKSGEPLGKTGLGDLYDHQVPVLRNYAFKGSGPFVVRMDQMMRTDTLEGVVSIGLGIEKVTQP